MPPVFGTLFDLLPFPGSEDEDVFSLLPFSGSEEEVVFGLLPFSGSEDEVELTLSGSEEEVELTLSGSEEGTVPDLGRMTFSVVPAEPISHNLHCSFHAAAVKEPFVRRSAN